MTLFALADPIHLLDQVVATLFGEGDYKIRPCDPVIYWVDGTQSTSTVSFNGAMRQDSYGF